MYMGGDRWLFPVSVVLPLMFGNLLLLLTEN